MIDSTLFTATHFIQTRPNSCVLASFGVAAFPFTTTPVDQYFRDYCDHYDLNTANPELAYEQHFDDEWHRRGIAGYRLILELHETSTRPVFSTCRQRFALRLLPDLADELAQVHAELMTPARNVMLVFLPARHHSVAVGCDATGLCYYDTVDGQLHRLGALPELGPTGDAFVLSAAQP